MSATFTLTRVGPLTSVQDDGRFGMLRHGISASGPMDRTAFTQAGGLAGGGIGGIEFTMAGLELKVTDGRFGVGFAGGNFVVRRNGERLEWPGLAELGVGDTLTVAPGAWGNYGYLRFNADLAIAPVLGSMATSSRARLGGRDGGVLQVGDTIELAGDGVGWIGENVPLGRKEGPIRVIWGLHAELFPAELRLGFLRAKFRVTTRMDRMGVRLDDLEQVFANSTILSLVSDAVVPGDIQIMGDGTPIVLMRDHQPTGGYPRIATIITADLDRFAQIRPGAAIAFEPVSVEHAHQILRGMRT